MTRHAGSSCRPGDTYMDLLSYPVSPCYCVVTGDRAGLHDAVQVEAAQSTLLAALKTHCSGRYGRDASVMIGRLLSQLVELRSIARQAEDVLTSWLRTTSDGTELAVLRRIVSVIDDHPASHHQLSGSTVQPVT